MTENRVRWRMTLDELCHRTKASPMELTRWAKLGAFGEAWQETTEKKWRHITRVMATQAITMKALIDAGMDEHSASAMASAAADRLMRGNTQEVALGPVRIILDPAEMDLP